MAELEEQALASCCGLYCGLCPRYQSKAPSRCVSCHLGDQRLYCSVSRCCVTRHGLHTCAECGEYPCERLLRVLGVEQGLDSFISHKPAIPNLERIREIGLEGYLEEQRERRLLAEYLLEQHNEGRSMSFYCRACALMPPGMIRDSLRKMKELLESGAVDGSDLKAKAKAMKGLIQNRASEAGISLELRRKPGE